MFYICVFHWRWEVEKKFSWKSVISRVIIFLSSLLPCRKGGASRNPDHSLTFWRKVAENATNFEIWINLGYLSKISGLPNLPSLPRGKFFTCHQNSSKLIQLQWHHYFWDWLEIKTEGRLQNQKTSKGGPF